MSPGALLGDGLFYALVVAVVMQTCIFVKTEKLCPSCGCISVYLYYISIQVIQKENHP